MPSEYDAMMRVVPVIGAVMMIAIALSSSAAAMTQEIQDEQTAAAGTQHAVDGVPAPEAWDYVRLTPEERHALRELARTLPEEKRREHNRAVVAEVAKLPRWIYEALSNERVAMDCMHGEMDGSLSRPPVLDGWAYARLVPHQRYHFRMRARALAPEDREKYETHLAQELASLPEWLRTALMEEAEREDARYGLTLCDGK